ncbi:MAG TPA: NAD(P)H-dependent glycerol-3-phosphate dehydrogenase [Usitatibacter sp.]|nr:NAD(P)H-dependent glycerol-3-phosphate dehydrogenase [Usitatibacter sp.]
MKVAILGAGAWGSALAVSFSARHDVRLWARDASQREALRHERASRYLPGVRLPETVGVPDSPAAALAGAELAIAATPTAGLRDILRDARAPAPPPWLWACKGFEGGSGCLPHEIAAQCLPSGARAGAFSGPSFALEVARGQPAAVVVTSADAAFAAALAASLNGPRLRVYSSDDVIGVELGGALKNVIAIAAGICDGLALGSNARAALVTRGLAEMARLGVRLGGRPETFAGLTGLGDLVLTCTGDLSRNRQVGLRLAQGQSLEVILSGLGHVAEGVSSARAAVALASRHGIEMPICAAVHAVLFDGFPARDAVERLLARDPKSETT